MLTLTSTFSPGMISRAARQKGVKIKIEEIDLQSAIDLI